MNVRKCCLLPISITIKLVNQNCNQFLQETVMKKLRGRKKKEKRNSLKDYSDLLCWNDQVCILMKSQKLKSVEIQWWTIEDTWKKNQISMTVIRNMMRYFLLPELLTSHLNKRLGATGNNYDNHG